MKIIYKIIALLLILASMTAIGCTDVAAEAPVNEVSSADTGTASEVELSDEIVQVQLVQNQPNTAVRDYTL
ncbi:MAG: hypothetical protein K8R13_07555 [Methanococcoides sp.]|nr:hypothetical protein [Methanococcoides sp.]